MQFEEKSRRKLGNGNGNGKSEGKDASRGGTDIERADRRLDKFPIRDAPTHNFSPVPPTVCSRSNSVGG